MNGKYLLDTNIVIGYTKNAHSLVDFINQREGAAFYLSVITRIELLSFSGQEPEDERAIKDFLADLNIISLHGKIEKATVEIRKATKLKLPDAIIAATSWVIGATLVTLDRRLANIDWPGLRVIVPA